VGKCALATANKTKHTSGPARRGLKKGKGPKMGEERESERRLLSLLRRQESKTKLGGQKQKKGDTSNVG